MITEDYVSLEVSKLLKEKGFNEPCRARYEINDSLCYEKYPVEASGCEMHNSMLAPTIQMVMKWLRKEYHLHIGIKLNYNIPRLYEITIMRTNKNDDIILCSETGFNFYEEACEAAIKYCLENLL